MSKPLTIPGYLNLTSPIDGKDEIDQKNDRCYSIVLDIVASTSSESEAHDAINNAVHKGQASHEEVCTGLVVAILIDPATAPSFFRHLCFVNRDGMATVIAALNQLIVEKFWKIQETARSQMLWLIREMIRAGSLNVDSCFFNLLRNIAGGDISSKNLALAEDLIDILNENRTWLDKYSLLVAAVVYTFLRLLIDHANVPPLKAKEIELTVTLIRERFNDCLLIGRDLIRLLINVARIPEFDSIWRDMLHNPTALSPTFTGIHQLMQTRTSRRYLQCRLTHEMERKITFLTSQVRFGQQRRYQDWFQRQYLSTPESQSLRCDLIRYICGVIHPTNEVLCSDIMPRWAVIGWIFLTSTSPVATANAKLSLFFDWLFYDPERDNIMNIEPAILVMFYSMRNHPVITGSLLDFLCRILPHFHPPLASSIRKGICTSLHQILDKRVLPSLGPLFESPKLDNELRLLIRQTFPEFCEQSAVTSSDQQSSKDIEVIRELSPQSTSCDPDVARFSDEENELGLKGKTKQVPGCTSAPSSSSSSSASVTVTSGGQSHTSPLLSGGSTTIVSITTTSSSSPVQSSSVTATNGLVKGNTPINLPGKKEVDEFMLQLTDEIRKTISKMLEEKDTEGKCEQMEKLLQHVIESDLEVEQFKALAGILVYHLQNDLINNIYPASSSSSSSSSSNSTSNNASTIDDEALEDSIGTPFFVILRFYTQCPEEDPSRQTLATLLNDMSSYIQCIGYYLLYYMKVCKITEITCYKELAKLGPCKDLSSSLLSDLHRCQDDDVNMFCFILPFVYQKFENIVLANASFLHLVVSCLDANQLQDLICFVLKGDIRMLKKENIVQFINASLEWETFEQNCLWHLINAHSLSIESFLPVLTKLEYGSHSEALTGILLSLRRHEPTTDLVKHVISRDPKEGDQFSITALAYWMRHYEKKMIEILTAQLTSKSGTPIKRKRQNPSKPTPLSPMAEHTLIHLNLIRQQGRLSSSFVSSDAIQAALLAVQNQCTEAQKARFSDLFALADEQPELKPSKKKIAASKKKAARDSASESDASEEEPPVTKTTKSSGSNQRKRRKPLVGSDSD